MLVQSKLRSLPVFLLRGSPKTLPLPFCFLPVKNVRPFHLEKYLKQIQNFATVGPSVTKLFSISQRNTFCLNKNLFRGVIPYKVHWNCRHLLNWIQWDFWPALSQRRRWWAGDRSWQLDEAFLIIFGSPFFTPFFTPPAWLQVVVCFFLFLASVCLKKSFVSPGFLLAHSSRQARTLFACFPPL